MGVGGASHQGWPRPMSGMIILDASKKSKWGCNATLASQYLTDKLNYEYCNGVFNQKNLQAPKDFKDGKITLWMTNTEELLKEEPHRPPLLFTLALHNE